jgi:hypothetical protein
MSIVIGQNPLYRSNKEGIFNCLLLSLLLLLGAILVAFCFWWFFLRVSFIRWFTQTVTAMVISAGVLYLIYWQWKATLGYKENTQLHDIIRELLLTVGAISLAYIYCYTVSAHISGECVAKAIRLRYGYNPIVKNKETLSVIFHTKLHPKGKHRKKESNDELHTYPAKESKINATFANDQENNCPDLSIEKTIEMALKGFFGSRSDKDAKPIENFRKAVAESLIIKEKDALNRLINQLKNPMAPRENLT